MEARLPARAKNVSAALDASPPMPVAPRVAERDFLPFAAVISEVATHAPSASFQILR
jgi:hypothetical protein